MDFFDVFGSLCNPPKLFLLTVYWGHGGAGIEGGGDNWRKWSGCSFQEVGIHANDCDIVGDATNFVNGGKDSDSPTKAL